MSCFIVDKCEFIKAAGLMCGYEEAKRHSHKWFIDNVRKEFEHAYALNVISVSERYEENYAPEEEKYDELFEAYRKKGALISRDGYASTNVIIYEKVADVMDKQKFRKCMFNFFNGVLYQIDNQDAHRAVSAWFYTCLNRLYDSELRSIEGWWGSIDLEEEPKAA